MHQSASLYITFRFVNCFAVITKHVFWWRNVLAVFHFTWHRAKSLSLPNHKSNLRRPSVENTIDCAKVLTFHPTGSCLCRQREAQWKSATIKMLGVQKASRENWETLAPSLPIAKVVKENRKWGHATIGINAWKRTCARHFQARTCSRKCAPWSIHGAWSNSSSKWGGTS